MMAGSTTDTLVVRRDTARIVAAGRHTYYSQAYSPCADFRCLARVRAHTYPALEQQWGEVSARR